MPDSQKLNQSKSKNVADTQIGTSLIIGYKVLSAEGASNVKYEKFYYEDIRKYSIDSFESYISAKNCDFVAFCLSVYPKNIPFAIISNSLARKLKLKTLLENNNSELINVNGQRYLINAIVETNNKKFLFETCKFLFDFINQTQGNYNDDEKDMELSAWFKNVKRKSSPIIEGLYYIQR